MAREAEWELKFELDQSHDVADGVAAWLPAGIRDAPPRNLHSIYYDTPKEKLRKRHTALRVRKSGDEFLQTIKQEDGAGNFARGEWEQAIEGPQPQQSAARGTPIEHFMARRRQREKLKPLFEVDVERRSCDVIKADSVIEASLDHGHVEADGNRLAIREFELELKRGEPSQLFETAREVVRQAPLRLSFLSKGERGYRLRDRSLTKPIPASTVRFRRRATAKEAMQAICRTCLHDLTSNVGTIDGEHAAEGVHKTRIAVRRMRAAMTLFKQITQDEESNRLRGEMKWLSDLLGEARDLDVLQMESTLPKARELSGGRSLAEIVDEKRHAARDKLRDAVSSQRFNLFLVDFVRWIENGDWLKAHSKQGDGSVARFARRSITRRRKRLLKKADHLTKLPPEARHKVRIAGKKLRYMTEFLEPLAKSKEQRRDHKRFVKQLEKMQTSLGTLHDAEARGDFFRDIADVPPAATSPDDAASAALSMVEISAKETELLRQAAAARGKLAKIGPKDMFAGG
ncbi:MAG: CHAD domain-containing protein [Methylobacteriaceae bacterium]|nr:CHAD domain-containing protein [Methylobacteriaceae bacterium]